MRLSRRAFGCLLLVSLWTLCVQTNASCGEVDSNGGVAPRVDQKVEQYLDLMLRHLSSLDGFSVQAELAKEVRVGDKVRQIHKDLTIKFCRPNRLSVELEGKTTFASDGKIMRLVAAGERKYIERNAPSDLGTLGEVASFRVVTGQMNRLLSVLFSPGNLRERLMTSVERIEYKAFKNGDLHRIRFYEKDINWELWIRDGLYTPDRFVITWPGRHLQVVKNNGVHPTAQPETMSLRFINWQDNPKFKDQDFEVEQPRDGQAFASISELIKSKRPNGPDPLLGKQAPDGALKTLEGSRMRLRRHLANEVVVVHFWSSRSGPSRIASPILARTRAAYRHKGVVFYAINVGEDKNQVQEHLDDVGLDFGIVLLDPSGEVAGSYGISGLPQSFIVDEEGNIRAVIRGFSSDLQTRFAKELDGIVEEGM